LLILINTQQKLTEDRQPCCSPVLMHCHNYCNLPVVQQPPAGQALISIHSTIQIASTENYIKNLQSHTLQPNCTQEIHVLGYYLTGLICMLSMTQP